MKNEAQQPRRGSAAGGQRRRPPSSAAAILSGGSRKTLNAGATENYFSSQWLLLWATMFVMTIIAFFFTPYTHQLDDIKNVYLMFFPPLLLLAAGILVDFKSFSWRTHGPSLLLGLFMVNAVFSLLINPYKMIGERVLWFTAACATFTVIFAWFMDTDLKVRRVMLYFTLLGLASTIFGLFLFAGQGFTEIIYNSVKDSPTWNRSPMLSPWITLFYTLMKSRTDMYSFILNPDFYAAFLVMTIPIPVSMFLAETRLRYKAIALVTFLLMLTCLVLTNSNDSYFSIIIAAVFYIVLSVIYVRGWSFSRPFLITLAVGMAALVGSVVLLMWPTVMATWDFKASAFEGRMVLWSGGFWPWLYGDDITRSHLDPISILFGVGLGGYRHYFPLFRRSDFFDQQINNVTTFGHNWYLDVLLETGAIGLLLFLAFHVWIFVNGIQQIRRTESRTRLLYQLAILTGLLGIAIQNFSSPNNRWAVAGMTYWAMFGLSMGIFRTDYPAVDKPDDQPGRSVAGFPVWRACNMAFLAFAAIFVFRSTFNQAVDYWTASKLNSSGLRKMEAAQDPSYNQGERLQILNRAREDFERAIAANPTFTTSYYKLGNVYNSLNRTDEAVNTYETLQRISPNYSEIHLNLGIMYYVLAAELQTLPEQLREEREDLLNQAAKARGDEKTELQNRAAQLKEQADKVEENLPQLRLEYFRKSYEALKEAARQSVKPNVQALTADQGEQLAKLYDASGQADKANQLREEVKQYYRTIISYEPKLDDIKQERQKRYRQAQERLLALSLMSGDTEETIRVLKLMESENPDEPKYLAWLLDAYDKRGDLKGKIAFLEKATQDNPLDMELRKHLATAYEAVGNLDQARKQLRRVELLEPQDVAALGGLYLLNRKQNPQDAAEYADKLRAAGVNPEVVTTIPRTAKQVAEMRVQSREAGLTTGTAAQAGQEEATSPTLPQPQQIAPGLVTTTTVVEANPETITSDTAPSAARTAPTPVTRPAPQGLSTDFTTAPAPTESR